MLVHHIIRYLFGFSINPKKCHVEFFESLLFIKQSVQQLEVVVGETCLYVFFILTLAIRRIQVSS